MNLIPVAHAATHAQHNAGGGFLSMLPIFIIFIAIFYFLIIRPQSKKSKAHQQLLNDIAIGDEVMTAGGIIGRIAKLRDPYVFLTVAEGVEIKFQKNSIAQVLPKVANTNPESDENN